MLKIVVLDQGADSRNKIVTQLHTFLQSNGTEFDLLPRISIKPLALEELKFHSAPDICIIGAELVRNEVAQIAEIRKLYQASTLLARTTNDYFSFAMLEQLVRLGIDDIIGEDITATEFFKRLLLLSRKTTRTRSGKLIVVHSGKGGAGVTSVAAGLGEALSQQNKKVVLVDLDFETQDLSRFLQAKPFINENLQLLFDQNRPITQESVEECLVPIWLDVPNFHCMPPLAESEDLYSAQSNFSRTLLTVLEVLDGLYECIVVDTANVRGAPLKTLYRLADSVIYLVNNDPASLYSSVDSLVRMRPWMSSNAKLLPLENNSQKFGLSRTYLQREFNQAARLGDAKWCHIPFSKEASRWPGSGRTIFSAAKQHVRIGLNEIIADLGLIAAPKAHVSKLLSALGELLTLPQGIGARRSDVTHREEERHKTLQLLPPGLVSGARFG